MTSPFRRESRGLAAYFDATELGEEAPRRRRIAALLLANQWLSRPEPFTAVRTETGGFYAGTPRLSECSSARNRMRPLVVRSPNSTSAPFSAVVRLTQSTKRSCALSRP